ncbi:hypothetical protein [Ignatzschineria sp. LJL83]
MKIDLIKKLHYLLFLVLMMTGMSIAMEKNNPQVKYQLRFKANYISCIVRINDVFVYSTYDSVGKNNDPIQISFGQDITQYLDQGVNQLSIQADNMAEYIPSHRIEQSYCEVDILAIVKNPTTDDIESKVVNNIRYSYEDKPKDSRLIFPYLLSIQESNMSLDERLTSNEVELKQLPDLYDKNGEPIQETLASRTFVVDNYQPFSWVNDSTPFKNTPENKKMLWDKYQEILKAVADKDKKAVRQLVEPGVTDMAKYYGDSNAEGQFEFSFADTFEHYFNLNPDVYEANPLTLDDYDLEIYAEGKLFRLNRKGYTLISPLRWENSVRGTTRVYNPIFTFIDGKIVMAWF